MTDRKEYGWAAYQAGAASRDAKIAELREANRIACEDLVEQQNLRVAYGEMIAELVAALESMVRDSGLAVLMRPDQIERNNHALAKARQL